MCNCKNVEIGSYKNQVSIKVPDNITIRSNNSDNEIKKEICIDACLVKEIKYLWSFGITTTGCCCGHNKVDSYIGVVSNDILKMKLLGYEVRFNKNRPNDEDSFIPKSI